MTSPGQEGKVARILKEELARADIPCTLHAKVLGRDNLLASVGRGESGYRRLMVLLHTDVVPAGPREAWRFERGLDVTIDGGPDALRVADLRQGRSLQRSEGPVGGGPRFLLA